MNWKGFVVLAAGLLLAADSKDDIKKELDPLQGTWVAVSLERDGKALPEDQLKILTRTVKGDQYVITRSGETVGKGSFKVDPTKKPKTIDITRDEAKDGVILGIYELDGDKYKICYSAPGSKERPKEFAAKEGSGNTLAVWKRDKK